MRVTCVILVIGLMTLPDSSPVGLDRFGLSESEAAFLQAVAWKQAREDRAGETR